MKWSWVEHLWRNGGLRKHQGGHPRKKSQRDQQEDGGDDIETERAISVTWIVKISNRINWMFREHWPGVG